MIVVNDPREEDIHENAFVLRTSIATQAIDFPVSAFLRRLRDDEKWIWSYKVRGTPLDFR